MERKTMNAVANGAMSYEGKRKDGYGGIWAPWAPGAIGAMVLGFVVFWPVGLAVLSYNVWGTWWSSESRENWSHRGKRFGGGRGPGKKWGKHHGSGNSAFDAYKTETLKRLEEEEKAFREFIEELRAAKDREEFDRFMSNRSGVVNEQTQNDQNQGSTPNQF
jgi:predicted CopG family antitoxin